MSPAAQKLLEATERFEIRHLYPPLSSEDVEVVELGLGRRIPASYRTFLDEVSNGGQLNDVELLPGYVERLTAKEKKRTWDSVQRHNDPRKSTWFYGDAETFRRFMVFAVIGNACFALPFEGENSCVWTWNAGCDSLIELDYDFSDWLIASAVDRD